MSAHCIITGIGYITCIAGGVWITSYLALKALDKLTDLLRVKHMILNWWWKEKMKGKNRGAG